MCIVLAGLAVSLMALQDSVLDTTARFAMVFYTESDRFKSYADRFRTQALIYLSYNPECRYDNQCYPFGYGFQLRRLVPAEK